MVCVVERLYAAMDSGGIVSESKAAVLGVYDRRAWLLVGDDDAAKALGVHRHTVENRLARVERVLGLDLGRESSRVRLWIACSFLRPGNR